MFVSKLPATPWGNAWLTVTTHAAASRMQLSELQIAGEPSVAVTGHESDPTLPKRVEGWEYT